MQEKVETSLLLKNLDQFNAGLSMQRDVSRHFDLKTNTVITEPLTRRMNWRQFFLADAVGAWRGGRAGAIYGSAFSPGGSIAGAAVGGILCAAVCSGVDAWVQNASSSAMDSSVTFGNLIQSGQAFDAEVIYDIYCKIPETKFAKKKRIRSRT